MIAGESGSAGRATVAPYCAAKGGLKMLTRAMAVEWARHNIQVNGNGREVYERRFDVTDR